MSPIPQPPPVVVKRQRRVAPKFPDDPPAAPVVAAPAVPAPVASAPVDPPPPEARARRFIPSKLDAFRDVLGVLPDWQIARRVDMTTVAVREYRRRHGIARVEPAVPAAPVAPVASAAAPVSVVSVPPVRVATVTHAYDVTAVRADVTTRFIGVGADISGALANAVAALAAREDGPWRVLSITDLQVVALVGPIAATPGVASPVAASPVAASPAAVRTGGDLRVYRVGAGLTQHLLGVRLGLRQSEVSKLEMAPTALLPAEIVEQLRKLGVGS